MYQREEQEIGNLIWSLKAFIQSFDLSRRRVVGMGEDLARVATDAQDRVGFIQPTSSFNHQFSTQSFLLFQEARQFMIPSPAEISEQ